MLLPSTIFRARTVSQVRSLHHSALANSRQPHRPHRPAPGGSRNKSDQPEPSVSRHAEAGESTKKQTTTQPEQQQPRNPPVKLQRATYFEEPYLRDTTFDVRDSNVDDPKIRERLQKVNRPVPHTEHRVQYNRDPFSLHPREDHFFYQAVTADDLAKNKERPKGVRMLARDFIHDSLYNPSYGYFSRQAVLLPHFADVEREQRRIMQGEVKAPSIKYQRAVENLAPVLGPNGEFDFGRIKNEASFTHAIAWRYQAFEEKAELIEQARAYQIVERRKAMMEKQVKDKQLPAPEEAKRLRELEWMLEAAHFKSPVAFVRSKNVRPDSGKGFDLAAAWGRMSQLKTQSDDLQEPDIMAMAARQVWHTPTELFKPYFAEGLARYLVNEYKMGLYPYEDLVIYEIGAGSGALAQGIMAYLKEHEPQVYSRTRYGLIEISSRLAAQQRERLRDFVADGRVEVHTKDVLQWGQPVQEPCFVIALEVFDNLAHDVVRYDSETLQPYQGIVSIDQHGDFEELWEPVQDPTIKRYLRLLDEISETNENRLRGFNPARAALPWYARYFSPAVRKRLAQEVPFWPNMTPPHFLPTAAMRLLDNLKTYFPHHRLVMSDFHQLPDTIGGKNAPVVQTRLRGESVAVSKYPVLQGFFDIFFPTDFEVLKAVYLEIMDGDRQPLPPPSPDNINPFSNAFYYSSATGRSPARRMEPQIWSQAAFVEAHADVRSTTLGDGTNPMLSWYRNVSWFLT